MFKELFEGTENFCKNLENEYKKYFPKGYFKCVKTTSLSSDIYKYQFGMVGDEKDVASGIRQNDPMWHSGLIFINKDNLELSPSQGGIAINPPEGSYLAMQKVKTKMRKTKGDHAKIEKYLKNFFKKLHGILKENQDNLYDSTGKLDKYKV
jgi:hypothetical protein